MKGKSLLASSLPVLGIISLVLVLIAGYFFLISFIERQSYGSGLLFADVELFGFVAILFGVIGIISINISRKISRSNRKENKN